MATTEFSRLPGFRDFVPEDLAGAKGQAFTVGAIQHDQRLTVLVRGLGIFFRAGLTIFKGQAGHRPGVRPGPGANQLLPCLAFGPGQLQ